MRLLYITAQSIYMPVKNNMRHIIYIISIWLKVFPLGGEKHKSKELNWEKVARMRRKRGASLPKISINSMKQMKVFPLDGEKHKHKKLNRGKVARMRRKRGARRLEISAD